VLYNAMVSIDAPKTLYFPSSADMELINKKYGRKALFLQYRENKDDVIDSHYKYTFGLLDDFTNTINQQLLDEIEEIPKRFENRARMIQDKLVNGEYNTTDYHSCSSAIIGLYEYYTNDRKTVSNQYKSRLKKMEINKEREEEQGTWDRYKDDEFYAAIRNLEATRQKRYKEIDAKYIVPADVVMSNYDTQTISNAIGNLSSCTEMFGSVKSFV
jgi:hypothetical protein